MVCVFFFGKQKTAYEMRISDWSSDVCSSDLSFPRGMDFRALLGMGMLCGLGFTMSLFIGSLAFSRAPLLYTESVIGVLVASTVSAVMGYAWLRVVLKPRPAEDWDAPGARVRGQRPDRQAAAGALGPARLAGARGVAPRTAGNTGRALAAG